MQASLPPNRAAQDGQNTQDPEASWTVEVGSDGKRESNDGYKAHDNVDGARFIKVTDYSTCSLHDSNCFTGLLTGEESVAYADSAYQSAVHAEWLSERGIENSIIKQAYGIGKPPRGTQ